MYILSIVWLRVKWNAKLFNLCLVWNTRLNAIGWISLQLGQTTNSWYWKFRILFELTNSQLKIWWNVHWQRSEKNQRRSQWCWSRWLRCWWSSSMSSLWWWWWWAWWTKWWISKKRLELHINNDAASYKAVVSTQINENATKISESTSYLHGSLKTEIQI